MNLCFVLELVVAFSGQKCVPMAGLGNCSPTPFCTLCKFNYGHQIFNWLLKELRVNINKEDHRSYCKKENLPNKKVFTKS